MVSAPLCPAPPHHQSPYCWAVSCPRALVHSGGWSARCQVVRTRGGRGRASQYLPLGVRQRSLGSERQLSVKCSIRAGGLVVSMAGAFLDPEQEDGQV